MLCESLLEIDILYFIVRDHTEEGLQIAWVLHIRKMSSNVLYICKVLVSVVE